MITQARAQVLAGQIMHSIILGEKIIIAMEQLKQHQASLITELEAEGIWLGRDSLGAARD